jgi:arginine decarboxylase
VQTDEAAGDYKEDLTATMLATTMGIQFDPETAWDERKQLFKTTGLIIKTTNITQSARETRMGVDNHHCNSYFCKCKQR